VSSVSFKDRLGRRLQPTGETPTRSRLTSGRDHRREPLEGRRPQDARRSNLRFVAETLESAGIGYFVVRAERATRSVIAVRREHRTATIAALQTAADDTAFLVTLVTNAEREASAIVPLATVGAEIGPSDDRIQLMRIFCFYTDMGGSLSLGRDYACDLEFWSPDPDTEGWLAAPRPNVIAQSIAEDELIPVEIVDGERTYPMARVFQRTTIDDVTFPVDAVYLWVDGADPAWAAKMQSHRPESERVVTVDAQPERFRDFEELRYSLRSLDMYAPWIRTIYLVTDGQRPHYLEFDDPRLVLVDHSEITEPDYLPMFNSDAIVTWLHRIPGLSEHFLYLNDDCFFGRDTTPATFFHPSGLLKVFPSTVSRPAGPVIDDEPMAQAKAKLTRARIEERFGRTISHVMRHTPHPMTRAMVQRVIDEYPDDIERTRRSRFRRTDDMPLDQMVHYMSQILGTGTRSTINYGYVNVADVGGADAFAALVVRHDRDVFCLNDAPTAPGDVPDIDRIAALLEECFPVPSRWERPPV
jgi:hypothetical protein